MKKSDPFGLRKRPNSFAATGLAANEGGRGLAMQRMHAYGVNHGLTDGTMSRSRAVMADRMRTGRISDDE